MEYKKVGDRKIIFSNEIHFQLHGFVNKEKCRIYGFIVTINVSTKSDIVVHILGWKSDWTFFFGNEAGVIIIVNQLNVIVLCQSRVISRFRD